MGHSSWRWARGFTIDDSTRFVPLHRLLRKQSGPSELICRAVSPSWPPWPGLSWWIVPQGITPCPLAPVSGHLWSKISIRILWWQAWTWSCLSTASLGNCPNWLTAISCCSEWLAALFLITTHPAANRICQDSKAKMLASQSNRTIAAQIDLWALDPCGFETDCLRCSSTPSWRNFQILRRFGQAQAAGCCTKQCSSTSSTGFGSECR